MGQTGHLSGLSSRFLLPGGRAHLVTRPGREPPPLGQPPHPLSPCLFCHWDPASKQQWLGGRASEMGASRNILEGPWSLPFNFPSTSFVARGVRKLFCCFDLSLSPRYMEVWDCPCNLMICPADVCRSCIPVGVSSVVSATQVCTCSYQCPISARTRLSLPMPGSPPMSLSPPLPPPVPAPTQPAFITTISSSPRPRQPVTPRCHPRQLSYLDR